MTSLRQAGVPRARRPVPDAITQAVQECALPSLAAFYDQDLVLRACTDAYAATYGSTQAALRSRDLCAVVGPEEHERLAPFAARSVAGETVHFVLRRVDENGRRQRHNVSLVAYVVDGEQLGVAVLTNNV